MENDMDEQLEKFLEALIPILIQFGEASVIGWFRSMVKSKMLKSANAEIHARGLAVDIVFDPPSTLLPEALVSWTNRRALFIRTVQHSGLEIVDHGDHFH